MKNEDIIALYNIQLEIEAEENDYIEKRKLRSKPKGKENDDIITY